MSDWFFSKTRDHLRRASGVLVYQNDAIAVARLRPEPITNLNTGAMGGERCTSARSKCNGVNAKSRPIWLLPQHCGVFRKHSAGNLLRWIDQKNFEKAPMSVFTPSSLMRCAHILSSASLLRPVCPFRGTRIR